MYYVYCLKDGELKFSQWYTSFYSAFRAAKIRSGFGLTVGVVNLKGQDIWTKISIQ